MAAVKGCAKEFVLYGGTAVALRYGHRESIDFDFFTTASIDVRVASRELPFIKNNPHELSQSTNNQINYDIIIGGESVHVTFLSNKSILPGAVNSPDTVLGAGIKIASPLDRMACKILALHERTEQKYFVDIGELIKNNVNLQKGFEASVLWLV